MDKPPRAPFSLLTPEELRDVCNEGVATRKKNGRGQRTPTLACNVANALDALRADARFNDALAFDEMLRAPILRDEDVWRPVSDADVTGIQEIMQKEKAMMHLGKDIMHQAVDKLAIERRFHPVRQYLDALLWDGDQRIGNWLATYLGAEATPYTKATGRMFLIGMVARILPARLSNGLHADPRRAAGRT